MNDWKEGACLFFTLLIVVVIFAGSVIQTVIKNTTYQNSPEYKLRQEVNRLVKQKELIELYEERDRLREYLKIPGESSSKVEKDG